MNIININIINVEINKAKIENLNTNKTLTINNTLTINCDMLKITLTIIATTTTKINIIFLN